VVTSMVDCPHNTTLPLQAVGDYLSLLRAYAMEVFDDKYSADPSPPTEDTILW
jgi:hypothetical protein